MNTLTLTPSHLPYGIGTDKLAGKANKLVYLLKSWGIETTPVRITRDEVAFLFAIDRDSTLILSFDVQEYFLDGFAMLIDDIDIDEDKINHDLRELNIIDDYFYELSDDYLYE